MSDKIEDAAFWHGYRSRELLNTINGFSELLADPYLLLSRLKRLEYAELIFASSIALNDEMEAFLASFEC